MHDDDEAHKHEESEYEKEITSIKKKARITRILETINYIVLPLQYLTKDIFLLFSSYNSALTIALPALRFISKSLSWVYGVSFVLEGICALIESTKDTNEDKRNFLISQGVFLCVGGILITVFAFTNPQIFLPLLCVVWGASTVLFLYDVARDYLKNKKHLKQQLNIMKTVSSKISDIIDDSAHIKHHDNFHLLEQLNSTFNNAIALEKDEDIDIVELKAEIMEKIEIIQDRNGYATKADIDNIMQEVINSERLNPKMSSNILYSTAYIVASFCCAMATFIFLGRADVTQSLIFTHIIITTAMIGKRLWDLMTNQVIYKAQLANISSKEMDQLNNSALKEKYLKIKLSRLHKKTSKIIHKMNHEKLEEYIEKYARIVQEINPDNHSYADMLQQVARSLTHAESEKKTDEQELLQLAEALQQSISSRLIYLGSNHSCVLCKAMQGLSTKKEHAQTAISSHELKKKKRFVNMLTPKKEYKQTQPQPIALKDIAKQCQKLLDEKKAKNWYNIIKEDDQTHSEKNPSKKDHKDRTHEDKKKNHHH